MRMHRRAPDLCRVWCANVYGCVRNYTQHTHTHTHGSCMVFRLQRVVLVHIQRNACSRHGSCTIVLPPQRTILANDNLLSACSLARRRTGAQAHQATMYYLLTMQYYRPLSTLWRASAPARKRTSLDNDDD